MPHALTLPTELTIYGVAGLRPQWQAWLAAPQAADDTHPIECCVADGAAVDEVDAAGLQLLVSLSHAVASEHRIFRLVNPSQPLIHACEALGLCGELMCADQDEVGA